MTTPSTSDSAAGAPREEGEPQAPGSGHGADSALNALIKRRVPPPEPPPLLPPTDD